MKVERPSELIHRYLDEALTDEEFAALTKWIRASRVNAAEFARTCWDHSQLGDIYVSEDLRQIIGLPDDDGLAGLLGAETVNARSIAELVAEEWDEGIHLSKSPGLVEPTRSPGPRGRVVPRRRRPSYFYGAVVAALVAVVCAGTAWYLFDHNLGPAEVPLALDGPYMAEVLDGIRASWSDGGLAAASGTKLIAGKYQLKTGVVQLRMEGGAKVTLEAPIDLELITASRVRISKGRLVGYVPPQAVGFTVVTPNATIVDLGTEFGVEVKDEFSSTICVMEGEVELIPSPDASSSNVQNPGTSRRLKAGSAAMVDDQRQVRDIAYQAVGYFRSIPKATESTRLVYPSLDARLVDINGDDKGDRVESLSEKLKEPGIAPSLPIVEIGEGNLESEADQDNRRYWINFELPTELIGNARSASQIKAATLELSLGATNGARPGMHLGLYGQLDPLSLPLRADAFESKAEQLSTNLLQEGTDAYARQVFDITEFVRSQLSDGKATIAVRLQLEGLHLPLKDGVNNSYILHSAATSDPNQRPALRITTITYE